MNREVQDLLQTLEKTPGVTVKKGGGGHYKVRLHGKVVGSVPASPSDWRWEKNCIAQLRQNGLVLDGYQRQKAERKDDPVPATKSGKSVDPPKQIQARKIAERIFDEIATAHNLGVSKNRKTAYGSAGILTKVLFEYHEASGEEIPHLNYSGRDTSDAMAMAKLLAGNMQDLAAGNHTQVTEMGYRKALYAEAAWDWHLGMKPEVAFIHDLGKKETVEEAKTVYESGQEWPPEPHEVVTETTVAASNGRLDDQEFAIYRLIAKLATLGVPEDDAVLFAVEMRDAFRAGR